MAFIYYRTHVIDFLVRKFLFMLLSLDSLFRNVNVHPLANSKVVTRVKHTKFVFVYSLNFATIIFSFSRKLLAKECIYENGETYQEHVKKGNIFENAAAALGAGVTVYGHCWC
jgi:hypothetical protein